ncbi:MAG TPA: hypothetical protein VH724_19780 [Candidatus Angelobacter sp.]|nr:hypothetical protein [Candidatus Angelobacter sp.]
MSLLKRRVATALAVVGVASLVTFLQVEANHETDDQIGTEAVWNAGADDLNEIGKTCGDSQSAEYNHCFIEQMGGYASSDAVAFSQLLAAQKPARTGYLNSMKEAGLVDLGYVVYPGSVHSNQGWVLLNGTPTLINVDDIASLPRTAMEKDATFIALSKNHSRMQLAVLDRERGPDFSPKIEHLSDGGERFVVSYSLQEPCDACDPAGQAVFGFDFDPAGQFLAVKFLNVAAATATSPKN